jgi:cobalt/nickel transport system permease protein
MLRISAARQRLERKYARASADGKEVLNMHIPAGALGPAFELGCGLATVPVWALATNKVRKVLNHRTVPLLAIFSAFVFTIMMFNIPVPLGTTAHAVGGTLIAIVLGPWAAMLCVSVALIIQALFFGDGGVLTIFANCLNMGIIMPFFGFYMYKLLAGKSPLLSTRRVWAAGISSYLAITLAAALVGVELGLQPLLFHEGGKPVYSPYPIVAALPAMLVTHLFGAALVEGLVTALGLAYIQKNHPHFLTSLRSVVSGVDVQEGEAQKRPLWQIFAVGSALVLVAILIAGLIYGGGDIRHFFGVNWSEVNWADVATMLLIVAVMALVLVPLTWLVLPKGWKKVGSVFMAVAILTPLGLITPGFAYGEGSPEDVQKAFGYIPKGLQETANLFSAPLSGYNLPLPFFSDANAALWQAALGYQISGMLGILVLGGLSFALFWLVRKFSGKRRSVLDEPLESLS